MVLFNVRDEVSHPYRTTGKIIVLYILIFKFFDNSSIQQDKKKKRFLPTSGILKTIKPYFSEIGSVSLLTRREGEETR
jgi:hypothetical protein